MTSSFRYADGHVLLRRGPKKAEPIGPITGGEFSHAGVCGHANDGLAVDAYPGRDPYAVAALPLAEFFGEEKAPRGGSVFRYVHDDEEGTAAAAAAKYARDQTRVPYTFAIDDPIVGPDGDLMDDHAVYCSEFVWRCYRFGANVELVALDDFFDLSKPENLDRAAWALFPEHLAQQYGRWARVLGMIVRSVPGVGGAAAEQLRYTLVSRGHNGLFVTPQQLAETQRLALAHAVERP